MFRCLTPARSSTIIGWSDYFTAEGVPMLEEQHFGTELGDKNTKA